MRSGAYLPCSCVFSAITGLPRALTRSSYVFPLFPLLTGDQERLQSVNARITNLGPFLSLYRGLETHLETQDEQVHHLSRASLGKGRRVQCVLLTPTFCEPSCSDRDFIGKGKTIAT